MTTTLQQIQDRAVAFSSANGLSSLVADRAEIINRIAGFERDVYDLAARVNRYYFAVSVPVTSTGGTGRSIQLGALTTKVHRLLKFKLNDGRIVDQVDFQDFEAELAPRYYVHATGIYEVDNDWGPPGPVSGVLSYMRGPAALSVTGDLTQTITLDDEFSDMLELRLAYYLAHKDVGRDPSELDRLEKMIAEQDASFVSHIAEFAGVESQRFNIPTVSDKK